MTTPARLAALAALPLLAACTASTIETAAPGAPLPNVELARYQPGNVKVWENADGSRFTETAMRLSPAGEIEFVSTKKPGCRGTAPVIPLTPNTLAVDCGDTPGTLVQSSTTSGGLEPLREGATQSWRVTASWNGSPEQTFTKTCTVVGEARVTVPAGTFDTWEIRCRTRSSDFTWHYAPSIGAGVSYDYYGHRSGGRRNQRLVSFAPGKG